MTTNCFLKHHGYLNNCLCFTIFYTCKVNRISATTAATIGRRVRVAHLLLQSDDHLVEFLYSYFRHAWFSNKGVYHLFSTILTIRIVDLRNCMLEVLDDWVLGHVNATHASCCRRCRRVIIPISLRSISSLWRSNHFVNGGTPFILVTSTWWWIWLHFYAFIKLLI